MVIFESSPVTKISNYSSQHRRYPRNSEKFYKKRPLENIVKKGILRFFPDFFDMDGEEKIRHIYEQESIDYIIKLMRLVNRSKEDKSYYESHMYNRIYDLIRWNRE